MCRLYRQMEKLTNLIVLAAVLLLVCPAFTAGARVLLLPQNINSHVLYFSRVGQALTLQGDEVTLIAASSARMPSWINATNITVLNYQVQESVPFVNSEEMSHVAMKAALSQSMLEKFDLHSKLGRKIMSHWEAECVELLEDTNIRRIVAQGNFDLAIVDLVGWPWLYAYPYMLNIPYATLSVRTSSWMFRIPTIASFVPSMLSTYSDHMTFFERLQNVFLDVVSYSFFNQSNHIFKKYAPDKKLLEPMEIFMRQKLWIFLDDLATSYPYPSMPNTLNVGDIIPQPVAQLPANWKQLVDRSEHGAIVVSFGSFFDHLPEELMETFCSVFKSLKQTIIWKLRDEKLCVGDNIHISSWIPQNDLLGQPNVKLFITHGGLNSVLESVYHAVPMLVVPISVDQLFNAALVQLKGYGMQMMFTNITREGLAANIHQVLTDSRYLSSIEKASKIMRNKPIPSGQHLSFMVNHVTKYGDDHLRTGAYKLNALQFYMLDIFAFVFGAAAIILILMLCILRCFCRCMSRCCCGRKKADGKHKYE